MMSFLFIRVLEVGRYEGVRNLFISLLVFGICALGLDAAYWIGRPCGELIKQFPQEFVDKGHSIVYKCGTFQVSFEVDMSGNIKSIWLGKLHSKPPVRKKGLVGTD